MTAPRVAPGQVVAGKYSIRALLGYGGVTATYTAVLAPGRDVVLKLFSPQLAQRSDVLGALQQVAAVTNGLGDSALPVLESGFDPQTGAPFMVTDLAAAPSLSQAVERGPLPPADVVLLLRGIARAVDGAHGQRLTHGALKPNNVFVGDAPQRSVKVTDFGVGVARAAIPTNEGYVVAAPWMAPEQMQGAPGGPQADIYSAALVAFFAATGKSYWRSCQGASPDLAALQQETAAARVQPSTRAREAGVTMTAAFDGALLRALSLNPAERFGSIAELADTLAKAGGAAPKNLAMTMPLNAMPQAAQDLIRQHTAAAVGNAATMMAPSPSPAGYGGSTLAISSPAEAAWPSPQAGGPQAPPMPQAQQQQGMPQPMQGMQGQGMPPQQGGAAAMLPTPYGGFQAPPTPMGGPGMQSAPPPMQAGAQPGYSMAPRPESSVVLPKSKTGLYIVLAIVGLLLVGGAAVALVLFLPRHGETASTTPETPPQATQSAPPPSTTAAATTPPPSSTAAATAAPPVETQDAGTSATASGDGGAAAAAAGADSAASTNAEVTVVCVPDCDSVKIDDKALDTSDAGTVPSEPVEVAVGPHTIAVGRATYLAQTKRVTLKAGQKAKETFYLTKPGAVAPTPKPCGKFLERCPN
ncbi:MAG TPA: serine/threonine-protein kinase [Polyangiaceae bacterium]